MTFLFSKNNKEVLLKAYKKKMNFKKQNSKKDMKKQIQISQIISFSKMKKKKKKLQKL